MASAWAGLALCVVAFYGAFGLELEDEKRKIVMPLGRHGAGKRVLQGGMPQELHLVEREGGVREKL